MNYETIRFEIEDRVATITLNRPERLNAWNDSMDSEIQHALRHCDENDDVRSVVITGSGRAFCAGADLGGGGSTFEARPADAASDAFHPWDLCKPVIAALNGHAVGVGITFAMGCDCRYVAEDAKISFAFVRRGVMPGFASHVTVARVVGLSKAADLMFSGRTIRGRSPRPDIRPAASTASCRVPSRSTRPCSAAASPDRTRPSASGTTCARSMFRPSTTASTN